MSHGFAKLPDPPYVAVIFSSQRVAVVEGQDDGYAAAAQRMLDLVQSQPGFLGTESARDAQGFGITVAYFRDEDGVLAWKRHPEHAQARQRGRDEWYRHFEIRVARVERAYGADGVKA